jgi:hypothetical protein
LPNNVRSRTAPYAPRRYSGPVRRPLPAGAPVRGRTSAFERIARMPDHKLVDRLLRSRAWVWLIGIMLGGIVAMQVSLLKLNAGISNAVTTAGTLERQNADIEAEIAKLSSVERVRDKAVAENMVTPMPGDIGFLHARGDRDAALATRRMEAPSDSARAIMENGGREPGVLAATATTAPIAVETPDPAGTVPPEAVATPVPTATPTPPPAAADSGATVAPQG